MFEHFSKEEVKVLRGLAERVREIAARPEQAEKRKKWFAHNSLQTDEPIIFVHPDGSWRELLPPERLECRTELARSVEQELRGRLIRFEYLPDDVPIEALVQVPKAIYNTWWGVEPKMVRSSDQRGSWHHVPIIEEPSDWKVLKAPVVSHDEAESAQRLTEVQEAIGDLLPVKLVGVTQFDYHMMHYYCDYRGLENMLTDLILEPEMVHDTIRFFTEGIKGMLRQFEEQNLISLNNDFTFHYTGGVGYTDELPRPGFDPDRVRLCDVWGAAEAQEFSSVSPEMHEEFILSYERELLEPFGLNGYGCCDDLGKKLDGVLKIKNLRRVAICPWADIQDFTPRLGKNYIMTWKPQPAYLATEKLSEEEIRRELTEGLRKARGGIIELILRDTHTCRCEPQRFTRWIEIARACIEREMQER